MELGLNFVQGAAELPLPPPQQGPPIENSWQPTLTSGAGSIFDPGGSLRQKAAGTKCRVNIHPKTHFAREKIVNIL